MEAGEQDVFDAVVVGAGFAGLYMLHRLRGLGMRTVVLEAGGGVGGTWYWNRYPGARCDVESMQYSYSFSPELQAAWRWSELFASQPEILRYAEHVADRFDLKRDIRLNTRVTAATYDADRARWRVETERGAAIEARFVVMATGCLSAARTPDLPGLDAFRGATYHTGAWPHEGVDFSGQRVGVIGTGSSAIQSIPRIAEQAAHLTVFQRTPNFSIPSRNAPMTDGYEQSWKADYAEKRARARRMRSGIVYPINEVSALAVSEAERRREYEARWAAGGTAFMAAFGDLILDQAANDTAAEFVREKIRSIVHDPAVAERLLPRDHPIGTKRICVDTDYYETYNRPNVALVDLRADPIETIEAAGLRTRSGLHPLDSLVFATGFDAMTGAVLRVDIVGRDGVRLRDEWRDGPRTYLGLAVAGFPNLFLITGPGSPSVLSNMIVSIEQHVDWIAGCLERMQAAGAETIEARADAQEDWVAHVNEVAHGTLYPRANSWYMGANIAGKPRVFMPYIGGVGTYRDICDAVAAEGDRGFEIRGPAAADQGARAAAD